MDFKYTYAEIITKICKFERQYDRFPPYLRKGRGLNSSNETIPLAPVTARHTHTHTLKLLLCYYFKENNVVRHLRVLNPVYSDRNMRFFMRKGCIYHISAQVCLCVWRAYGER